MEKDKNLYYVACIYAYTALSDEEFIFDPPQRDDAIVPTSSTGDYAHPEYDDLVIWLLDEILDQDNTSIDFGKENMMDEFTKRFIPGIWRTARLAQSKFPDFSLEQWTMFLFYRSLITIIESLDDVMERPELQDSPFRSRYLKKAETVQSVVSKLRVEAPCPTKDGNSDDEIETFLNLEATKNAGIWEGMLLARSKILLP